MRTATRHQPALVVRAVFGNRLRAGTQRRHVGLHRQHKINFPAARRRVEPRDVIHQAFPARHRRPLGHEIRKLDFDVRRGGVQFLLQRKQNVPDVFHVDDAAVRVEHLDEPAHVRAFEFLRQIHEHADGRHGVLDAARLVAHLDGKAQSAHADLVNAQLARVALGSACRANPRRNSSLPRAILRCFCRLETWLNSSSFGEYFKMFS